MPRRLSSIIAALGAVTALLGQDGEVAQGEVAVDALINAAKLVGTFQGQDPPPACFGLGGLAGFAEGSKGDVAIARS